MFQGHYKSILVQKEAYLLGLSRYVVLNPVRAGMVKRPEDWAWSSYRAHQGFAPCPDWLDSDWLLTQFGKRRSSCRLKFEQFVSDGAGCPSPLDQTRHQLLLGDEAFVGQFNGSSQAVDLREHSEAPHRALAKLLAAHEKAHADRHAAMVAAFRSVVYTQQEIADYFGVHVTRVSRAVIKDESYFRRVTAVDGTVCWPHEQDICSDTVYKEPA